MENLFASLVRDAVALPDAARLESLTQGALLAFSLVAARLTGLVVWGPVFGHSQVPARFRAVLVLALSCVLTPALWATRPAETFSRLDHDGDGRVTVAEAPPALAEPVAGMLERAGKDESEGLAVREFRLSFPRPSSAFELAGLLASELALGLALGLGVTVIVSSAQMAGSLIDQQIGTSLASVFNPELQTDSSLSGQMLYQFALVIFLTVGGHHLAISALIDTFQVVPVGYGTIGLEMLTLLNAFVHQSLLLALKIAAPVLATLTLVGLGMGIVNHAVPQVNVLAIGFPVRALVGVLVLGLAVPGMAEVLARVLPDGIEQVRQTLLGLTG